MGKELKFKSLPEEMQQYIFTFFNQKELRSVAPVSSKFEELSQREISRLKNQYKNNIFYTVGAPIHISDPRRTFGDSDLMMKHRKEIPDKEIYESFLGKNIKTVKLFINEYQATEFSRFLRTGDQLIEGTEVFQPAVFKVIYLGNLENVQMKNKKLAINPGHWAGTSEWSERMVPITFFATDRVKVIPLEGILRIHLSTLGEYKTHGPLDYSNLEFKEDESFSFSKTCTIS